MSTMAETAVTTQVYRVYIKASPEAIWDAITKPEWNEKYGYPGRGEYDLRPGGAYRIPANEFMRSVGVPPIAATGEVIEASPPHRLVQTWQAQWEPKEGVTRLTFEIADRGDGVSELTVIHELEEAPGVAAMVGGEIEGAGGGWWEMLSDVKSLLETGRPLRD